MSTTNLQNKNSIFMEYNSFKFWGNDMSTEQLSDLSDDDEDISVKCISYSNDPIEFYNVVTRILNPKDDAINASLISQLAYNYVLESKDLNQKWSLYCTICCWDSFVFSRFCESGSKAEITR